MITLGGSPAEGGATFLTGFSRAEVFILKFSLDILPVLFKFGFGYAQRFATKIFSKHSANKVPFSKAARLEPFGLELTAERLADKWGFRGILPLTFAIGFWIAIL